MVRESKLSYEEKIAAIKEYEAGKGSYKTIAGRYGVSDASLKDMAAIYESQGEEGLVIKIRNKKYSSELKEQAVIEYLTGECSQRDICKKYKIFRRTQLRSWIKVYNGHKGYRSRSGSGTEKHMTKGRKTSQEERAEIVAFCIEHGKDYGLAVQEYGVSYQQIYAWVRKYEAKGVDGLADRRGKAKPESEMTEAEMLRTENRILEARIKDLEMENALIKKLKELGRGGR